MYFIPRNNIVYNYIAHTNKKRRYLATFFILTSLIIGGFYIVYNPLNMNIAFYKAEHLHLKKQCEELNQLDKSIQEYTILIEKGKKKLEEYAFSCKQDHSYYRKHRAMVIDLIKESDLILHSYSSYKKKEKDWYNKNVSHFIVMGSLQKFIALMQSLKKYDFIMTISKVICKRIDKDLYQIDFDINLVTVKNPSTLK